jgi:hypothetical protein
VRHKEDVSTANFHGLQGILPRPARGRSRTTRRGGFDAWHYQGFVCNLLARVETLGESYSFPFQFPKRLKRFNLGERDLFRVGMNESRLLEICEAVAKKTIQPQHQLGEKLSIAIVADIEELNEAIDFIIVT